MSFPRPGILDMVGPAGASRGGKDVGEGAPLDWAARTLSENDDLPEWSLEMFDLIAMSDGMFAFALPVFGIGSLLASRLATGPAARHAQQFFIAALALVTVATLRTVIQCELTWLTHMMTLMIMIVGAVVVPSQRICSGTV